MNLDKRTSKRILILVAISLAMVWLMLRLDALPQFVDRFFSFFTPLWIGIFIAYVVNLPMRFVENKLFSKPWKKNDSLREKIKRPVSMLIAFLIIFAVLAGVIFLVFFDLTRTLVSFVQQLPQTLQNLQTWLEELTESNTVMNDFLVGSNITFNDLMQRFINWLNNTISEIASSAFSWVSSLVNGFMNFFFGFVFSIYFLIQKEKLVRQVKQVAYAALPESLVDRILQLGKLVNTVFSRFVGGQGLEAVILGVLVFFGMTIFGFPYPLTISVLVILGALVPVFGAFIAGLLGAVLIMVESPIQALWFIVMLVIIQQIEGNFIYPRVVGQSVGLPAVWVLFAVMFGSKLFGFIGLLLGVPMLSVVYILIRAWSHEKIQNKDIEEDKLEFSGSVVKESKSVREAAKSVVSEEEEDARKVFEPIQRPTPKRDFQDAAEAKTSKVRSFKPGFDLDKVERELEEEVEVARKIRASYHRKRKNKE